MGITDLEEQFTFYASYHHSTLNKVIHIVCVWPILWSGFVLSEYIPYTLNLPQGLPFPAFHPPNLTLFVALFYAGVYIIMDKRAGTLGALLVMACLITGRNFYLGTGYGGWAVWQVALGVHVAGWVAQFVGHGAFEGRSPALLDNLFQALVMAPLFVLLEVLFMLGYRPDFQKRMWKKVEAEVAKFKAAKSGGGKGGKGRKK